MDKELKKAIAVIFQYIEETQAGTVSDSLTERRD